DEEFWLEDGNIILVTSLRPTAFRVYKALLARQVEAFADMFASSTAQESESYQGCPVVQLADAPEDLRHLLRVLVPTTDPLFCRAKDGPLPTLHQFSAIIRLSHKYRIERLQEEALTVLKDQYCNTLDAYDRRVSVYARPVSESCIPTTHMIEIIELARLTDTTSLLPVAFYETQGMLLELLMDSWLRENGTVVHLSRGDLQRCVNSRADFHNASLDRTLRMVRLADTVTCELGCRPTLIHFCGGLDSDMYLCLEDPLGRDTSQCSWSWLVENYDCYPDGIAPCETCIAKVRAQEKEDREKLWARLPWIFSIEVPGWPA
ncbi:hypothetical protein OH76DRAFT_1310765, partial [Lentinus brumalis]